MSEKPITDVDFDAMSEDEMQEWMWSDEETNPDDDWDAKFQAEQRRTRTLAAEEQEQEQEQPARAKSKKTTPVDGVLDSYDDSSIADAFVAKHPELIWNSTRLEWMLYDATRGIWAVCSSNRADKQIDSFLANLKKAAEADGTESIVKAARRCGFQATQEAVAKKIKTKRHIEQHQLDADPYCRVFANGVFDPRDPDAGMAPFDPELYSTRCVPLSYRPDAAHSRMRDLLLPLPEDAHEWFQLMAGQSMVGFQPAAEFAIFMYGPGAGNGKSVLFDMLEASIGKYEDGSPVHSGYAGRPSQETLLAGENYDLVSYEGLSQAGIEELPDKMIHSSPFKRLIGTQSFKGRQIREKHRMVANRSTMWITCNILPAFDSSDQGVIRRIKVLPFDKKFVNTTAELALYPEGVAFLKDPSLAEMAKNDRALQEAFLAWRMQGAIRWCATPTGHRAALEGSVPPSVQRATDRWLNREDTVQSWIEECLIFDESETELGAPVRPIHFVLVTDLFKSYTAHMRASGHAFAVKLSTFLERFDQNRQVQAHRLQRERGRVAAYSFSAFVDPNGDTSEAGKTPNHIKGIRFRNEMDEFSEPAVSAEDRRRLGLLDLAKQLQAGGFSLDELAAVVDKQANRVELVSNDAPLTDLSDLHR